MDGSSNRSGGVSLLSMLAVLFIGLKLTDVIDWSWWWVTLPLWGGAALSLFVLFIGLIGLAAASRKR